MRTFLAGMFLLSTTSVALGQEGQDLDITSRKVARVGKAIDAYMERRWMAAAQLAGSTQILMRKIAAARLDVHAVEKLLRLGRANLEPTPQNEAIKPGRFTYRLYPLTCEHIGSSPPGRERRVRRHPGLDPGSGAVVPRSFGRGGADER